MRGDLVHVCSHLKVAILSSSSRWFQGLHVAAFVCVMLLTCILPGDTTGLCRKMVLEHSMGPFGLRLYF